uniref:WAPL domain-containing protein n=1 Tax=Anopheles farauti TaxID=69004 RepID=A0A182QZG1_9DIPT
MVGGGDHNREALDAAASSVEQEEPPPPPKSELKIKISLGGKPLISSTTSNGTAQSPGTGKGGNKYNFKKRAIEREKARSSSSSSSSHHPAQHPSSSKRNKFAAEAADTDGGDHQQHQHQQSVAPVSSSTAAKGAAGPGLPIHQLPRPSFPLPGTDTYEVFRTLSSLSGGDDFDSQSSILGSASSDNNTPKHSLNAPGDDCQIIHSRGSSDCGSDLELSQNSSTAAAPPSDVYSESENTQDNARAVAIASSTTSATPSGEPNATVEPALPHVPLGAVPQSLQQQPGAPERVEVLKLNLKHAGTRVTRNKMKQGNNEEQQELSPQQQQQQHQTRVGRTARNRGAATNNNNNVIRGTRGKQEDVPEPEYSAPQPPQQPLPPPPAALSEMVRGASPATLPSGGMTRQYSRRKKNVVPPDYHEPEQPEEEEETALVTGNGDMQVSSTRSQEEEEEFRKGPAMAVAPLPPPPAAAATAAPMRLVLQKKGTIFKSRPLVGSCDGATDTKKRHVYKHKWDHGNGTGGGGGSGGGGGVPGAGTDPIIGGVVVGGSGGSAGVGGDLASAVPDAADGARADGAGGLEPSLVGGGPGGAGGQLEYDDAFYDAAMGDTELGGSIPPRSKRLKLFATGGGGAGGGSGADNGTMETVPGGSAGALGGGAGGDEYYGYCDAFGGDAFGDDDGEDDTGRRRLRCDRQTKPYYTIVRNVKNSHQMQEIGEFQEMDDDVDYILSALHPDNPIPTRCLSALQLATKCMKPAFKMHVRAHGVVTRFFRALSDAHQDPCLGLCTAAIMYVFSQDKLNMDLDRDSLALMLNLLDTGADTETAGRGSAAQQQLQKNRQRVKQLCEEIKGAGKGGKHIDTDRVTAGSLAMESLLSLTSQRAGEWFKDELRNLGGIERLIKTVAECYETVPARATDWTEQDVAKLRKIERCLRVLNNVCLFNRPNQAFLLEHRAGLLVELLVRLYRQVDRDLPHYPTDDATPKDTIGVLLRELLQPMLHMLITLTHAFDDEAHGAHIVGRQPDVINITMHLLLRIAEYVPQRFVFDLHLLTLTLLLHLARPSQPNRQQLLRYMDSETNRGGIKALVEYFEQQEEMASHAEAKTNAILETPARTVDAEDAETKLIQKAEHHMEHTYMGSHVCMLICQLVMDELGYEEIARQHLKHNNFKRMVAALTRYYDFLNLTTNADAESTAHKRQTKEAIDYLSRLDGCDSSGASGAAPGNNCQ